VIFCRALSDMDKDTRAAARQTPGRERAASHWDFVILSSFNASPARTIRASSFIDQIPEH
jgi:hypothetical protein